MNNLPHNFLNPPKEFSLLPFWFWNDDLDEAEILRQIDDFEAHGVHGFLIHPRVGLPRDLGWMSDKLLHFYRIAIEEAKRRGMFVLLYDEGMYPSGSSSGQVVAENPAYACRCLAKVDLMDGEELQLEPDHNLVAVVRRQNGSRMAVIDRKVDAVIRGLHYVGDGPAEEEPPAADLLNPEAVATFVRLVYDRFAQMFSDDFNHTILAIFTDEPMMLGRCRERDVWPGTTGILTHLNRILGYDFTPHLATLWYDDEPDAERHRLNFSHALYVRLEETYYRQLSHWCKRHELPLTGHPSSGDHIGPLRHFHMPGQDLVWRWVLPDDPTALEGPESTQGKCSSSAMLHSGQRRNINEFCGAYGHELTWDEMNWLANWCLVRGVNLLIPHAFYYSIRGPRWDERPPDVGPNSEWWDRYHEHADACRRLCWLNTDSQHLCDVAILGKVNWLPWRPAKICFQHQIDFNYVEERDLLDRATINQDGLHIADRTYQTLILAHEPDEAAAAALAPMAVGGRLIRYEMGASEHQNVEKIATSILPDVAVEPAMPALRVRHLFKEGIDWYILFNEEKEPIEFTITFPIEGECAWIDPVTAKSRPFLKENPIELAGHQLALVTIKDDSARSDSNSSIAGR